MYHCNRHSPTAACAAGCISPLAGMLGTGAEPTDIGRRKHEMVRQAFDHKQQD